jgi:hypothetical protein
MSTKHVRTAGDLVRFAIGLQVDCDGCGRSERFAAWDVAKAFGNAPLETVRKRLKCSGCGAKKARLIVDPMPEPR